MTDEPDWVQHDLEDDTTLDKIAANGHQQIKKLNKLVAVASTKEERRRLLAEIEQVKQETSAQMTLYLRRGRRIADINFRWAQEINTARNWGTPSFIGPPTPPHTTEESRAYSHTRNATSCS